MDVGVGDGDVEEKCGVAEDNAADVASIGPESERRGKKIGALERPRDRRVNAVEVMGRIDGVVSRW